MPNLLTWFVGNRNPSIAENIVDDAGDPVDLTGATVHFQARLVGSDDLIVDAAATIVAPDTDGNVRYDWQPTDTQTGGILADPHEALVWWQVTSGGKTQDLGEALIQVVDHAPGTNIYLELEQFKASLEVAGTSYLDHDLLPSLLAGSRAIDAMCNRRFWLDPDANQVRYYSPKLTHRLWFDDLTDLTSIAVDTNGDGSFGTAWTENNEFVLEPLNADADGKPWTHLELNPVSGSYLPRYPRSVKITGQFGWAAVPQEVKQATSIVATQLAKRVREAPFGIVGFGLEGEAIHIAMFDPHVSMLLEDYVRERP